MLTYLQLLALHRGLANKRVLTVYVDGSASDPGMQRSWRIQLDNQLADLSRGLEGSSRAEREEFNRCVDLLDTATKGFNAGIGALGWAAFITAEGIHDAQQLSAPTPTLAAWSTGPCVGPYVRALKERLPVIVVVADARRASIYRYSSGKADRVDVIRASQRVDQPEHMGSPPRQGFHTGTRGTAGRDAAQHSLLRGRDRMIAEAADRAYELAGGEGWILLGGIKRVAARLAELLEPLAPNRVTQVDALDVHSSEAQIGEIARTHASELRDMADDRRVAEIIDLGGAHGLGAIGPAESREALAQSSVHDLFVTRRYFEDHAADAEQAIRSALDQNALIEEVSGRAAERLNQHGGMAAGLRFRAHPVERAGANV